MKLYFLLGNKLLVYCSYVIFCFISVEWEELWDEESAHMYADIIETAHVLEEVHNRFAGINNY